MTQQRVVGSGGVMLNVVASGRLDAPVVVLSHSIGCDLSSWDGVAALLEADFRVLRFDRRGHGASGVPEGDATIEVLGADALAVMDAFGIARAHFVGLSQGGMEGMWLAANHAGRMDRLVLANTTAHLGVPDMIQAAIDAGRAQGMAVVGNGFLDRWLPQSFRDAEPDVTAGLRATFAAMSPEGFAACAAVLKSVDLRAQLPRIAAPTLVVVGGAEAPPLQAAAQAIVAAIPGARLASIEGAGHLSGTEDPAAFARLVRAFLLGQ
ncbi:MAG: 3-oxoadipate enol-lactonase [Pseudomonadota bacterium]|jgi:3-oxoadipate enol-lactonase